MGSNCILEQNPGRCQAAPGIEFDAGECLRSITFGRADCICEKVGARMQFGTKTGKCPGCTWD